MKSGLILASRAGTEGVHYCSDSGRARNMAQHHRQAGIPEPVDGQCAPASPVTIGFIKAANCMDVQWFKPLAYGYLKAYLERHLPGKVTLCLIEDPALLEDCRIVAISATSQDYSRAIRIARDVKLRSPHSVTILGGHHISYLPDTLSPDFDVAVLGEGEQTLLELVEHLLAHDLALNVNELGTIKGIVYRDAGRLVKTEERGLIATLDALPHPDRSAGGDQYIFTSRGCPYKCSFCSSSAFWEKTRFFSAEFVVAEIEQLLAEFPETKHIQVWDDLFIAERRRLVKIIELLEEKGINARVPSSFSVRANLIDDELCLLLKRLNVIGVGFGAESGSNRILRLMNKGTTIEQNQRALDLLKKYGIATMCSFIVGWPTETEEDVRSTYEFILKNIAEEKLTTAISVNILMPIPGTELWEYAVTNGLIVLQDFDWERLAIFASFRDSNAGTFLEWIERRRCNNSVYLAEETLPQERLYEIMTEYQGAIDCLGAIQRGEPFPSFTSKEEASRSACRLDSLVESQYAAGNPGIALKLSHRLTEFFPGNHENWNNLGVLLSHFGRVDDAKKCLRQALSVKNDYGAALENLQKLSQTGPGWSPAPPSWKKLYRHQLYDLGSGGDGRLQDIYSPLYDKSTVGRYLTSQFTDNAAIYKQRFQSFDYFQAVIADVLQRLNLPTTEGLTILDVGSGSGNSIIPLLNLCPDSLVIASDLSIELLVLLKEVLAEQRRGPNCALMQLNAEEIDFHNDSFDFVFGIAILHHLFSPDKTLAACKNVLKPGGHAVFFEPFETGHMALRNIYGAILDDPRQNTLHPETAQFLRAIMFDFDTRKGRDKSSPQFQQMDDKWLFTAKYFREICEQQRFSEFQIQPFGVSDMYFADKTETFLHQALGKGCDVLPEWAWEKIRLHDTSYSHDAKEELLMNCCVIVKK